MKFFYSRKFKELFKELPPTIRKKIFKQVNLLAQNPHHPSLHVKKIQGHPNVWEARVDYHYRFTFNWKTDSVILRTIGAHDEALKNP